MKTLIIIPIKNAYKNILDIITDIEVSAPGVDYIIIDRHSTDRTKYLLENNNINRLMLSIDIPYYDALSLGIKYAFDNGYDNCIQLNQSGAFDGKDIKYFIATAKHSKENIIMGSRYIDKKMNWKIGNIMTHTLRRIITIFCREKISDPFSNFKLIDRKIMSEVVKHPLWSIDTDAIANLIRVGYTYKEIQINVNDKKNNKLNPKGIKKLWNIWSKILLILFVQPFRKRKKVINAK